MRALYVWKDAFLSKPVFDYASSGKSSKEWNYSVISGAFGLIEVKTLGLDVSSKTTQENKSK